MREPGTSDVLFNFRENDVCITRGSTIERLLSKTNLADHAVSREEDWGVDVPTTHSWNVRFGGLCRHQLCTKPSLLICEDSWEATMPAVWASKKCPAATGAAMPLNNRK